LSASRSVLRTCIAPHVKRQRFRMDRITLASDSARQTNASTPLQLYGCRRLTSTRVNRLALHRSRRRPETNPTFSTNSTSWSRDQERCSARSRATTESSIARRHSRRCGCRENNTEHSSSCRITCDRESRASGLTDTVGDRACLGVSGHGGDEDEDGGSVEEAHGCSGFMRQLEVRLVAVTGKTHF
jgi:hypothetical protein